MKSNIIAIFCVLMFFSVSAFGQKPGKTTGKNPVDTVKAQEGPVESGDRFFS